MSYANQKASNLGLTKTHFADASGISPQTVSSAQDLVLLGQALMDQPVLAEIVNQQNVTLPVAGKVNNYNTLLGVDNIIGIKTGNTDQAGGCFLFATKENINNKEIITINAILGAQSRNQALQFSKAFLESNVVNYKVVNVAKKGQVVGKYEVPWGDEVDAIASDDVNVLIVNGEKLTTDINLNEIRGAKNQGEKVGTINSKIGLENITVPIVLNSKITSPGIFWRIFHP